MDFVLPYVDSSDVLWKQSILSCNEANFSENDLARYRSWDALPYVFRSVDKYLPFVDRIVLIVASPSQVPSWVNTETVRIVYHDEFIPKEFLPTFNSCTIESFLYNIEDISDKFIYSNDDVFALNNCIESDFFSDDTPNLKFRVIPINLRKDIYLNQCRSGMDMITTCVDGYPFPVDAVLVPQHTAIPMTYESLQVIKYLCGDSIKSTITPVRSKVNVNQYIYSYYHYFTGNYAKKSTTFVYHTIWNASLDQINQDILDSNYQWVCLNDSRSLVDYDSVKSILLNTFNQKFPHKCKYEKDIIT